MESDVVHEEVYDLFVCPIADWAAGDGEMAAAAGGLDHARIGAQEGASLVCDEAADDISPTALMELVKVPTLEKIAFFVRLDESVPLFAVGRVAELVF